MNTNPYNRPQRKSNRLTEWDYGNSASYYITICTKDKFHFFGEIRDDVMHLSPVGDIAKTSWLEIPNHFENVSLGEFVIMPNHIHGVIDIRDVADTAWRLSKKYFFEIFQIKRPS